MVSRLTLAVVSAFAISLLYVGAGGAAVCDPHCSPSKSNKGGDVRGLDRAQDAAGDHGLQGRCNAATRQGVVLNGCGGDPPPPVTPPPVTPPPPPPTVPPPPPDPLPPPGA